MAAVDFAIDSDARPQTPAKPYDYRLRPLKALKAFKRLVSNKEDTEQVFVIMQALSGRSTPRGYARMLNSPEGGRQAYLAEELADKLMDRDWVASFAPGTVGAGYRDFIAPRGLTAYGLAEDGRKVSSDIDAAHPVAWYGRRMRDVHDIWHVLTGYGTDALGEACIVSFSFAQTKSLGFGFIGAGAARELSRARSGLPYAQAIFQAWRNGQKANWLADQDYVRLFAEPLESARARLNIARPTLYESIPAELREGSLGKRRAA
jgi:ubiquinone biosynthesis protein COQ4